MIPNRVIIALVLLLGTFLAFEFSPVDLSLQDQFHHFETHTWWVNAYAPVPRWIFYLLPKAFIWVLSLTLLVAACLPLPARRKIPWLGEISRRQILATLAVIGICPLTVSLGKMLTNVHTPAELVRYGGRAPYLRVTEPVPPEARHLKRGLGFPAGHACGGFALMGLTLLTKRRQTQRLILAGSIILGWTMGIYQMVKGVHFLSHTVISMLLCWLILESTKAVLDALPDTVAAK